MPNKFKRIAAGSFKEDFGIEVFSKTCVPTQKRLHWFSSSFLNYRVLFKPTEEKVLKSEQGGIQKFRGFFRMLIKCYKRYNGHNKN